MKKSMSLITVLAVLVLAFSGCVGDQGPQENVTEPVNPAENTSATVVMSEGAVRALPSDFEYLATLPMSTDEIKSDYEAENVSGILGGNKSLYEYSDGTDFYVAIIECENSSVAEGLISEYKASFNQLRVGSRFAEESFNDHNVLRVMDYITNKGEEVERYTFMWNRDNFVFVAHGNTDNAALIKELAEATGK